MQDILSNLWCSDNIHQAAYQLREALPGFAEAQRDYDALAEQIQAAAGYDLYDRYFSQLMRYSAYELQAYYALGLGLRKELAQVLGL